MWLHCLKVAQLLRSAACLHTNQSRSYLNHLVNDYLALVVDPEVLKLHIQKTRLAPYCDTDSSTSFFQNFSPLYPSSYLLLPGLPSGHFQRKFSYLHFTRISYLFLSTLPKLRKMTISCVKSVCQSVCPHDNSAPTRRIFTKFEIYGLFSNLLRKFKFD